jgi:RNA polymerase sigma factor (sigma-70 family)
MAVQTLDPTPLGGLIAAIQRGDENAAGELLQRCAPMLRRVLRVRGAIRWLQSQLESQDLVQSVFRRALQKIREQAVEFHDEAALERFLRTVGRNRLRDHLRRQRAAKRDRGRVVSGDPAALARLPATAAPPGRIAEAREQVARIAQLVAPADLQVLQGRADGSDWQELAEQRGTTAEALRKRIERIRRRLQENL